MKKLLALFALTFALCLNASSQAQNTGTASLAWDASPDTRVTEYKLYYSTTSGGPFTSFVLVSPVPPATLPATQVTVTGLVDGATYFFVVTAFDVVDNLESAFSLQVSTKIPFTPLPQVTGLKVTATSAK